MTIASSGTLNINTELLGELRRSSPYEFEPAVMNDVRRLTDRTIAQNIILPTHLHSKANFKLEASSSLGAFGTSHSFSGLNFGANYSGRKILVCGYLMTKASADISGWNLSSISVGGKSVSGFDPPGWQGGAGSTAYVAAFFLSPASAPTVETGTISFNTGNPTRARVHVFSASNLTASVDSGIDQDDLTSSFNVGALTCGLNDLCIASVISYRAAGTPAINSWGASLTEILDSTPLTDYRCGVAFRNRLSAGTITPSMTFTTSVDFGTMIAGVT